MSEPVKNLSSMHQPKPLQVLVVGKVTRSRRFEQFFYTTVICPAPDPYSKPAVIEIRSKQRLGERDEEIRVTAELGGFEGRSYQVTDKETGERRTLIPVNHFLNAVEH